MTHIFFILKKTNKGFLYMSQLTKLELIIKKLLPPSLSLRCIVSPLSSGGRDTPLLRSKGSAYSEGDRGRSREEQRETAPFGEGKAECFCFYLQRRGHSPCLRQGEQLQMRLLSFEKKGVALLSMEESSEKKQKQ